MPRIEQEFSSSISISSIPSKWFPLLVDDKTHVRSIIFSDQNDDEEEENNNTNNNTEETTPSSLSPQNAFYSFYKGDCFLSVSNDDDLLSLPPLASAVTTSSSTSVLNCNIIRLHSMLRLNAYSSNSNEKQNDDDVEGQEKLPAFLFGNEKTENSSSSGVTAVVKNVAEQLSDSLSRDISWKYRFIENNFLWLMKVLMPTTASHSESSSSGKTENKQIQFFSPSSSTEEKNLQINVPSHIQSQDSCLLFDHPELLDRYLFSYSTLLGFFGWRLHSFMDGTVDRAAHWKERYQEISRKIIGDAKNNENDDDEKLVEFYFGPISGMLRSLIDMRLRKIAVKLVHFLLEEFCCKRLLFLKGVWETIWVPMVLVRSGNLMKKVEEKEEVSENSESNNIIIEWEFDESQREHWLQKLNETDSSDDD